MQEHPNGRGGRSVITIPIVFHVVYNNASENISDAQVMSQLEILNEDFRRLNDDTGDTRVPFDTVAADTEIQFCLAERDPNGNPTSGITRTSTSHGSFSTSDDVKFDAQGGQDAWPASDYLNFWVCNLGGGLLGYAQFPGGNPATDGVVVNYENVGDTLNVTAPYDLGRTGTHEVGHWLDLYHTFQGGCAGTTPSTCATDGDRCCDTPPIQNPSTGCPSNTQNTCSETPERVDQWENYMDYTYDACMNMFSKDQKARMQALFAPGGARESLLSSNGCVPPTSWDVAITDILDPSGSTCGSSIQPRIVLSDLGGNSLSSVDIEYNIDGAGNQTYSWSGSLNSGESDTITLPTMSPTPGAHTFNAYTLPNTLNGSNTDQNQGNDASSSSFNMVSGGSTVNVTIETDCYGSEVEWELVDTSNGNIIGSGGPYTDQVGGDTHNQSFACVPEGCYAFKIFDAYGDGMYGSQYGGCSVDGDYYLTDAQGDTLAQLTALNADYGDSAVKTFCLSNDTVSIDSVQVSHISCNGASDGSIAVFPDSSVYEYSNDGGSGYQYSNSFSALSPGAYELIIRDTSNGTSDTTQVTITQPPVLAIDSIDGIDPACGNSDGSITIHASGGTPPYSYSNDNGSSFQSGNAFSGLSPGTYDIVVEDDSGCTISTTVTLNAHPSPTDLSFDVTDETCGDSNGVVTITNVTGGTSPYQYDFDGSGYSASTNYSNLSAGSYSVTVQDDSGCTYSESVTVNDLAGPTDVQVDVTDATCGNADGQVTVTGVTGGASPYEYRFDGGAWTSSNSFSGLMAGTYTLAVRDTNDCMDSIQVTVDNANAPNVSLDSIAHPACAGDSTGFISVVVIGGNPPYSYQWNDPQNQSGAQASGLFGGAYTVTVTDANGCSVSFTDTIQEPSPLSLSENADQATCSGVEDGSITLNVSGGTPPYNYNWSNGMNGASIDSISAGNYDVTVTDQNGCSISERNIFVGHATDLVLELEAEPDPCAEGKGKVMSDVSGGTPPYSYVWGNGDNGPEITGLNAGVYTVEVSDTNGCKESSAAEVRDTVTENCLDIPNVITPNGDGINDRWDVGALKVFDRVEIKVFNRWGSLVYKTSDPNESWDGTRNGKELPEASYHYVIVVNGGERKFTGAISIVR